MAATKVTPKKVTLDEAVFGIEPNQAVLHQVVTAQLAARRAGTQSTKTRADVRGGGVAASLVEAVVGEAKRNGWGVVRWITAEDNARARALYDRIATRTQWVTYEIRP